MEEDGGDDGRNGKEREDPHLTATGGTEERQYVVDASEQDGPADGSPVAPMGRSSILSRKPSAALRGKGGGRSALAGEAGAGAGSAAGLGEATSPSAVGSSDTSSGRPKATTWGLSLAWLFTPFTSLPFWAQVVGQLSPVKHFIEIMRAVLVRGAGFEAVSVPLVVLVVYGFAVSALSIRQFSKVTS